MVSVNLVSYFNSTSSIVTSKAERLQIKRTKTVFFYVWCFNRLFYKRTVRKNRFEEMSRTTTLQVCVLVPLTFSTCCCIREHSDCRWVSVFIITQGIYSFTISLNNSLLSRLLFRAAIWLVFLIEFTILLYITLKLKTNTKPVAYYTT